MESIQKPALHACVDPNQGAGIERSGDSPFGRLIDGLNGLGSLLIFAMMVLVCSDVVARSLFDQPIYGVAELVSLSIVAIVFLQLASTLRHGRMTRADLFIDALLLRRPRAGHLLSAVFNAAGLFACAVIVLATLPLLVRAWSAGLYIGVEGLFTVPTWPVRLIVLFGAGITALQYLIHAYKDLRTAVRGASHSE
jgi:TRAP-type C4-dicarboxylate transport system permease small subunit